MPEACEIRRGGDSDVNAAQSRTAQEADPNAGVDDDQLSRLIASRSPVHFTFPFRRRISPCRLNCSSVRNPSSTASRFVRAPEAFKASAISLSSMTMLVLARKLLQIGCSNPLGRRFQVSGLRMRLPTR
jgi:hypothetical protein